MKIVKLIIQLTLFITPLLGFSQITYESAFPNISFKFPVEIQSSNDGSDRLFVIEQEGKIKVFPRNSNVQPSEVSTFLDITNKVSFSNGQEIGLLGLAFHPNYSNNGYFYVFYTAPINTSGGIKMILSRFSVNNSNPNLADNNSELIIFEFNKSIAFSNHNGGKITFGSDGYLYLSIGDGGGANDPQGNGQNTNTVFGSILRIDVDIDGSNPIETNPILPNGNYEIPIDNPFVGINGLDEIYAYGIRNTWKFSIDYVTNTIWGADVGQGNFEEINIIRNGENYGWVTHEGFDNNDVNTADPVFVYGRSEGDRSITGGYVYRGSEITSLSPNINSKYIFGDYISGRVWALEYNPTTGDASSTLLFKTSGQFISSFGQDINGELYFSDYSSSAKLYKLIDGISTSSATAINGIGSWSKLQEGISGSVNTIESASNGNIYVGGTFNSAGTTSANNIAVWNYTSGWQNLGSGSNGTINTMKLAPNGNLYVGGAFTEIGSISTNSIAVWDGSSWSSLGLGIEGTVAALEIDSNGNLYAGGVFEALNSVPYRNIAKWDGSSWSPLTDAMNSDSGLNNEVRALAIDDNDILYVGGNFDEAGGKTANRIATWDGTNWGTLGTGTSGFVEAISINGDDIYLGGNFAIAGGLTVNRIARWNKNSNIWFTVENGVSNLVSSLLHDGTDLYIGGSFDFGNTSTNSFILNNIAIYNPTNGWAPLGSNTDVGVNIKVNAMAFSKDGTNKLFVGGNFSSSGSISANNIAEWSNNETLGLNNSDHQITNIATPNPTHNIINLKLTSNWILFSMLGQKLDSGISKSVNLTEYPLGIYLLKLDSKNVLKIIKN